MFSGWLIALAALVLLESLGERFGFVGAAVAVEALGLCLLAQSYRRDTKAMEP
jgi:hypothetical protein